MNGRIYEAKWCTLDLPGTNSWKFISENKSVNRPTTSLNA